MRNIVSSDTTRLFRSRKSRVFGFTLIEIMVVVAIIGILMTVGMASYLTVSKKARDGKRKADLEQVRAALVLYRTDAATGKYPTSITWSTLSPIASYLSSKVVQDPKASPYPQYTYTYNSTTNAFSLCATTEVVQADGTNSYCVTNP
jgi:prepilin-type N-terminal cleavage/methylation domain-containing protein